ncbi:restriction endonuclease, SacI family [Paraburkholderia sp. SEWSISQ10-3 4]|uniref:restriction endonuclease, SacI family n=1 Tax=Paraburkholderia TaxID=1822464 RepID=UPI00225514B1|nr:MULTISPECIES: restriction endonuclease, SacI family [Paraburkholderia]MCX4140485.1 restriction endonuclease, SacI family [Paraburkholderia aspalathi]MDN7173170.1 restriction endonuclease, SacI family [Paraburkholderia sp. SEWSISQ10-3 4]MDQ6502811.1 restriction endonuclease, SacI family [Paraburkholderia aspalathi]
MTQTRGILIAMNHNQARDLLRQACVEAKSGVLDNEWVRKVETLSELCEAKGGARTHIAFLGAVILAKAVDPAADLYAIKPKHAEKDNEHSFSARTLCHSVLVPLAAELAFNIGVNGREPLNNQPYFRMTSFGDGTPVSAGGRPAYDCTAALVADLTACDQATAWRALCAYIAVRSRYVPHYAVRGTRATITVDRLPAVIEEFVREDSERGKRAQAIVAGLFDACVGPDRVTSGGIHDPSRNNPGDVCIRPAGGGDHWEKAIEVRDKPVSTADVFIFGQKCAQMGVREGAVVMVSAHQPHVDQHAISAWAAKLGMGMTVFRGWPALVEQVLFWANSPKPDAASHAIEYIDARLVAVQASQQSLERWHELTQ